ncbi:hypothetical protein MPSEU_000064700 [Mayamaea pseudoterrestris]|nr:hypothetical protein MPSEU_000063600 [Mayamaea pseudoterrestris]GKY90919.1 hypothetical protein MPSEU_000064700 [Mayamaea pseudoterrestris]
MSRSRLVFSLTVILSLTLSSYAVTSFMPSKMVDQRNLVRRWRGGSSSGSSELSETEKATMPMGDRPAPTTLVTPLAPAPAAVNAKAATTLPAASTDLLAPDPVPPVITDTSVTSTPSVKPPPQTNSLLGPNATPAGAIRRAFPSFPWHELPNYLTYLRCAAIPLFVYTFYQPNMHVATSLIFAVASLTDWLDGYLARRWDVSSSFGAFLDPVADKLMVSTCLILLTGRYGVRVAIPSCVILAREMAVSALREWMATRNARETVKVGMQGKVKAALTMVALTLLLAVPANDSAGIVTTASAALGKLYVPAQVMLYASALITVTSGSVYFRAAAPILFSNNKK